MGTRKILPWVAAASVALVALHPGTSWLVQLPIRGVMVALTGGLEKNRQRVAAQNPENMTLALAAAEQSLDRVRALKGRFPNSPEVHAAAARLATRAYGMVLAPPDKQGALKKPVTYNATEALGLVADTTAGARLDPDNAFFPAMKAAGLLALKRDHEAWSALSEAAEKPLYNDYTAASMRGKLQLLEQTQGRTPTSPAMALIASELFPHYASLKTMVLWAQERAIAEEKAGNTEAGMSLRQNILSFGLLVRRDANTLIGTYMGEAICAIAVSRPKGMSVPEVREFLKTGESEESAKARRSAQVVQTWKSWVLKTGHTELAEAATENYQHITDLRAQQKRSQGHSVISVETAISEALLLFLATWLFFSAAMILIGALRKNKASVVLPVHPMRLVAITIGIEALGVALMLLASAKSSVNLGWVSAGILVLGMILPDFQTALLARHMGVRYRELAPATQRTVNPVLACLLFILWSGLMLGLGQQESRWHARLDAAITHEYLESRSNG